MTRPWIGLLLLTLLLGGCRVELYNSLPEDEANQMLAILIAHRIDADKQVTETGVTLKVEKSQFINAVGVLRLSGYPRQQYVSAEALFPANQLVVSPAQEQQKINYLKEQRIGSMLSQVDGVIRAEVTIASADTFDDGNQGRPVSVAVFIKYSPQVNLQVFRTQIINLIEKSIPGIMYDQIGLFMQMAEIPVGINNPVNVFSLSNSKALETDYKANLNNKDISHLSIPNWQQLVHGWNLQSFISWLTAHRLLLMSVLGGSAVLVGVLMLFGGNREKI